MHKESRKEEIIEQCKPHTNREIQNSRDDTFLDNIDLIFYNNTAFLDTTNTCKVPEERFVGLNAVRTSY